MVDLDRGDSMAFPPRARAVDAIAVSLAGDVVVLARRSGATTVYTSDGVPVAQLLGELYSDGANVAVERLAFDTSGRTLLMVARGTVLVWRRPSFALTVPHDATFRKFDDFPAPALAAVRAALTGSAGAGFTACASTRKHRVDDSGALTLCVTGFCRTEFVAAGVSKDEFGLIASRSLEGVGHQWIGERADRILALSPAQILRFVDAEARRGRLWAPDSAAVAAWIAPRGSPPR